MERRDFIRVGIAGLIGGSLSTPRVLHEFRVEIWLARLFALDQVPMRFTTYAACGKDVWDWLDRVYPHHEVGQPELWTSAWKKSVGCGWDVPYRLDS